MKTPRPRWNRGALFSSRPLQYTPALTGHSRKPFSPLSLSNDWGFEALRFDEEAMQQQSLMLKQLLLLLPDGTRMGTDDVATLCRAVPLDKRLTREVQQVDVLLAFPPNKRQCDLFHHRYRVKEPSALAYQAHPVGRVAGAAANAAIALRFSIDENSGYRTYPVARLNRNAQGRWEIDSSFIPPLRIFSASPLLVAHVEKLLVCSRMKRRRLLALRYEQRKQHMQAEIPLFWLLNTLNRYESVLSEVLLSTALHPESVYRELVKLTGPLLPYTHEWNSADIPRYDHNHPGEVFLPLFALLNALLESCLPARAVGIDLRREKENLWVGQLQMHDLDSVAGFYLLARSSWASHRLQSHLLTQCNVGTRDTLHRRNKATANRPLQLINRIPAAIPMTWENLCFKVDLAHSGMQDALASRHCAISVPDHAGDLTLELFALMDA